MSAADPATEVLERTRREFERATQRMRNGVRLAAGEFAPDLGQSAKEIVWSFGRAELWRYVVGEVSVRPPVLILPSLVSRSYILDLQPHNSFVVALGKAAWTSSCWTGESPTTGTQATRSRPTSTSSSPRPSPR